MPLLIYGLRGGHTRTHAHILWRNESDFKKPGAAPGLIIKGTVDGGKFTEFVQEKLIPDFLMEKIPNQLQYLITVQFIMSRKLSSISEG